MFHLEDAPQLVIETKEIDCGLLEPNATQVQKVTLRNTGKSALTLKLKDLSPDTQVELPDDCSIAVGESLTIPLAWTPALNLRQQSRANVRLVTNDPRCRILDLVLRGEVRSSLFASPLALTASRALPNATTEMKVLVASQRWKEFELADGTTDLTGLTWHTEPAESETLREIGALSGWWVHATLPAGLSTGKLVGKSLHLQAMPVDLPSNETAEPHDLEIPIDAKVLRRLAVYGGGIDKTGTIQIGTQPRGVAHRRTLVMKVNDEIPELALLETLVQPEFLNVTMTPYDEKGPQQNLYQLQLEIPADAPEHVASGKQLGEILLKFDHPRIDDLKLYVDFVLHGRATGRSLVDVN